MAATADNLDALLAPIAEQFQTLAATLGGMVSVAGSFNSALINVVPGLKQVETALASTAIGFASVAAGIAALGISTVQTIPGFTQFTDALVTATSKVGQFYAGLANKAADGLAGIGKFGQSLGAVAGSVIGPFVTLASSIGGFVAALNPSVMQAFNYVLRNLMATIGIALVPVIQVFQGVIQQLSVTLYPAMKALAPILRNLADVAAGTLIPVIGTLVDLFLALAPIIEFVTEMLSAMADSQRALFTVLRTVIQTLLQSLLGLFGGVDFKDIAKEFRTAIQEVTKQFILFAAYLSKWISSLTGGSNNFLDNLIKNFQGLQGKGETAIAAPQQVGFKGFEQIGKDIAVAAFAAQAGGTGKKETNDFLQEISDALKEVKENNKTIQDFINEKIDVFMKFLEEKFGITADDIEKVKNFLEGILEAIKHPIKTYERASDAAALSFVQNNPDAADWFLRTFKPIFGQE